MNDTKQPATATPTQHVARPVQPVKDRGTTALVLGIVGMLLPFIGFIPGALAVWFGRSGQNTYDSSTEAGFMPIKESNGKPVSRSTSTAGLVLGIITLGLYALWLLLILIGVDVNELGE